MFALKLRVSAADRTGVESPSAPMAFPSNAVELVIHLQGGCLSQNQCDELLTPAVDHAVSAARDIFGSQCSCVAVGGRWRDFICQT